jgi:hypothetical protein
MQQRIVGADIFLLRLASSDSSIEFQATMIYANGQAPYLSGFRRLWVNEILTLHFNHTLCVAKL